MTTTAKAQAPPPKAKYLDLSPEELERVSKSRRRHTPDEIDPEWLFIAEFGYYFGWGGVQAILNNEIRSAEANVLLLAARQVFYRENYHQANGTFAATLAAVRSKKPVDAFKDGMKGYRKAAGTK